MTVFDFKKGGALPAPLYKELPYVILTKADMVLSSGTEDELKVMVDQVGTYYDKCEIRERQYDLYLKNNERL